ncbi:hypothetical protein Tco_0491577 [Tanacetum coccineum]
MSTRSTSNDLVSPLSNPESVIRHRRRNLGDPSLLLDFEEINMNHNNVQGSPPAGIGDAIVVPPVVANQFELKIGLLNLVTAILILVFEAGGNLLTRNTQEALTIIENKSKVRTSRNKPQVSSTSDSSSQNDAITALTKQVAALVSSMNKPIHSIHESCETCGGPHAYYKCQATSGYTQDERIIKKKTKNEAKSTKPDSEWKSKEKTKSKSMPKPEKVNRKSTQVNPEAKSQEI